MMEFAALGRWQLGRLSCLRFKQVRSRFTGSTQMVTRRAEQRGPDRRSATVKGPRVIDVVEMEDARCR